MHVLHDRFPGQASFNILFLGKLSLIMESQTRGLTWSELETKCLINIWGTDEIQRLVKTVSRNRRVFEEVTSRLASTSMGFPLREWDKVRDKINRIRTEYRKIKERINREGEDKVDLPFWFADMDAVLSDSPASSGVSSTVKGDAGSIDAGGSGSGAAAGDLLSLSAGELPEHPQILHSEDGAQDTSAQKHHGDERQYMANPFTGAVSNKHSGDQRRDSQSSGASDMSYSAEPSAAAMRASGGQGRKSKSEGNWDVMDDDDDDGDDDDAGASSYASPLVEEVSLRELEEISDTLGLGLAGSPALAEYRAVIADGLSKLDRLGEHVEPSLPVAYPRLPGYRPTRAENPFNAWYVKTTILGASCGKLAGKRIAVKDSIAVAGVPMMIGCKALQGYVPDVDATVVTRLLDAGGTVLGKASCENLCLSANSHSCATGPVLNPLNTKHMAGGSSSGSAVLVACNEVDIGIGADQGGSVRIPAAHCGLVGLKPTFGLVPYTGAYSGEITLDHLGPITRTVEDCALALEAIAGYDDGKDARQPSNLEVPKYSEHLKEVQLENIRVAVLMEGFNHECSDPEVDQLISDVITLFTENCKAPAVEVSIPLHKIAQTIGIPIGTMGSIDCMYTTGGTGLHHNGHYPTSMMQGIGDRLKANLAHLHPTSKALLLQGTYLKRHYSSIYGKAQNLRCLLTKAFDDVLADFDVIAMPTVPFTPPKLPTKKVSLTELLGLNTYGTSNAKSGNLTGHPSISVHAGSVRGLPVGLLLTGRKFGELQLLQVAYAFERFISAEH